MGCVPTQRHQWPSSSRRVIIILHSQHNNCQLNSISVFLSTFKGCFPIQWHHHHHEGSSSSCPPTPSCSSDQHVDERSHLARPMHAFLSTVGPAPVAFIVVNCSRICTDPDVDLLIKPLTELIQQRRHTNLRGVCLA
jgi:hypothetical protein